MTEGGLDAGLHAHGLTGRSGGPFDLAVRRGTCVAITGQSGTGKSVLLRMIADLDPHEGQVWLDGVPRETIAASLWRRRVGYVPAQSGWWADRVLEHFGRPEEARLLGERLFLPETLFDAPVAQLSTGERQRLALLRALERAPEFLLLDEPCSGLDRRSTLAVEALLREHCDAGLGMILVSHDMAQLDRLAQHHLRLEDGRLVDMAP